VSDPSNATPFASFGDPQAARPVFNAEAARARLAELQGRLQQSTSATKDMAEQLSALRATARDENEVAEATVNSSGALIDLRLSAKVQQLHPADSSLAILAAVDAAKTQLAEQTREIIAGTIGQDSPAGQAVLSGLDKRLGLDDEENR
jgi:DNA-binding protein YbaB